MDYKTIAGMMKTAEGADYSVVRPDAVGRRKLPKLWNTTKALAGGYGTYLASLPEAGWNASATALRGAVSMPMDMARGIAQTPRMIQRAWNMGKEHFMHADGGAYAGINGFSNKWNASDDIAPYGYWKAYADTANEWKEGWDKGMKKILPTTAMMDADSERRAYRAGSMLMFTLPGKLGPNINPGRWYAQTAQTWNSIPKTPAQLVNKVVGTTVKSLPGAKYTKPVWDALYRTRKLGLGELPQDDATPQN